MSSSESATADTGESTDETPGPAESADEQAQESTESDDSRALTILRAVAGVGGVGMAGSYLLTWVTVVGPESETIAAGDRAIAAGEIHLLPAVVAALGVIALVVVAARWTRPAHLLVLLLGILGLSVALTVRGFVTSGNPDIRIGGARGPASAFEPAIGVTLALVGAALLVAAGLGAFSGSFDRWPR